MPPSQNHSQTLLKIGAVSRLTGLSVHVLRKWEERHGAVVPVRTGRGERLYERNDVRRLAIIKRLTDAGLGLSEVATLGLEQLERVAAEVLTPPPPATGASPGVPVRIAVVGDALPALSSRILEASGRLSIQATARSVSGLAAAPDAAGDGGIEVLVLELPTLGLDSPQAVQQAMTHCGARACVVVYGFASEALLAMMRKPDIALLRAPANADALLRAVLGLSTARAPRAAGDAPDAPVHERPDQDVPPPRLSRETVARVAAAAPTVKCECPHHIAELVFSLLAFEDYSAECENLNPDDAALHRYLGVTAARARASFEEALIRVAEAEGIPVEA